MGQLAAQANHGPNAEDDDDGGNIAMVTTKLRHLYQPTAVHSRLKALYFIAHVLNKVHILSYHIYVELHTPLIWITSTESKIVVDV